MIYTKEKIEELRHRWTTPHGKSLIKKIKTSRCYLSPILFKEQVKGFRGINDPELEDGIDLRGAPLSGFDFRSPIKEDDEGFTEEITLLSNIHFEGAFLRHCNFQDGKIHNCHFEDSDLSHADFKNASINTAYFEAANCSSINLRGTKLIDCHFSEAIIRDVTLDSTITDQKTNFGSTLKSEKDGTYHFAAIEYKQIKELYKNSSLHSTADEYHYKEMVAKRKNIKRSNPTRWISYIFGDLLCKYGTSFLRVGFVSIAIIAICALLYTKNTNLIYQGNVIEANFLDSLYFSIVTFTTLGYGDFHLGDNWRFLAAAESFAGAAFMALFTVIVARNIIRD